jgi:hypothetical protein
MRRPLPVLVALALAALSIVVAGARTGAVPEKGGRVRNARRMRRKHSGRGVEALARRRLRAGGFPRDRRQLRLLKAMPSADDGVRTWRLLEEYPQDYLRPHRREVTRSLGRPVRS